MVRLRRRLARVLARAFVLVDPDPPALSFTLHRAAVTGTADYRIVEK